MGKLISVCFLLSVFTIVFWSWFSPGPIIGGDWPYFFEEMLSEFRLYPQSWNPMYSNGLGGVIQNYFLNQYLHLTVYLFVNILHISWIVTYKVLWFGLFLALASFSIGYLFRIFFPSYTAWQFVVSVFLFAVNTYILMIVGGGQMGIALAYAITPFVLSLFIQCIDFIVALPENFTIKNSIKIFFKKSIILGLVLATQIMFDPRMAYMTIIVIGIYFFLQIKAYTHFTPVSLFAIFGVILPVLISILLHMQWILPLLVFRSNPLPEGVTSTQGFLFFSFADFSHAFSLLHPNWPENIFGKTYFLKSEFLGLPLLAYSSLLFVTVSKFNTRKVSIDRMVVFFSLLGLLGAFLAKGAIPPFGDINQWLFAYVPGMNLFRDPTKFYTLIALSYSILIPFSIFQVYAYIKKKLKTQSYLPHLLFLCTVLYLSFLISPAIYGKLGGTFQKHEIPREYIELKDFLLSQPEFFRTLWVPKQSRFAFVSSNHPAIEAMPLFEATTAAETVLAIKVHLSQDYLVKLSVRYIIIPYDSLGEIFLKDRKYNHTERMEVEKQLDTIPWLKKRKSGNISIYETISYNDRFILQNEGGSSYEMISPTKYSVLLNTKSENRLIFSENYNPYWIGKIGNRTMQSIKTDEGLNSFIVPFGEYRMDVFYRPDVYYFYGRIIAIATFLVVIVALVVLQATSYHVK